MSEPPVVELMFSPGGSVIAVGVGVNMNVETLMATEALECAVSVSLLEESGLILLASSR